MPLLLLCLNLGQEINHSIHWFSNMQGRMALLYLKGSWENKMKLYDQSQLLVGCNKCSYTGSVLEGATHSAYCFLTTDLKFLIILSLNLCFVSESNGDRKHEQSRHTGCQHTQVQAGTLWYSGRWTEASTEPAAAPGREYRLSP